MEKIGKESNLRVTFSKRKSRVVKNPNELCTLTGVEAVVMVFSPTYNKAYSFGSPDVNTIVNRYTNPNGFPPYNQLPQLHGRFSTQQYNDAEAMLEEEKNRGEGLDQLMGTPEMQAAFPSSDELNPQLFELLTSSARNVEHLIDLQMQNANSTIGGNYSFGMPSGSNAAGPS